MSTNIDPEFEERRLDYGTEVVEQAEVPGEVLALRQRMRDFVKTQGCKDVEHIINMCLESYKVPQPQKEHERYGYEVYNHMRDGFARISWAIYELANMGEQDLANKKK